jgi:hypothetical protein
VGMASLTRNQPWAPSGTPSSRADPLLLSRR